MSFVGRTIKCRSCRKPRYVFGGKDICVTCETKRRRRQRGECVAVLFHGPGHQSHTYCEAGRHHQKHAGKQVHCAEYSGGLARWFGREKTTGYFDEAPDI